MNRRSFVLGALGGLLLSALVLVVVGEMWRSTRSQFSYDVYGKGWYWQ